MSKVVVVNLGDKKIKERIYLAASSVENGYTFQFCKRVVFEDSGILNGSKLDSLVSEEYTISDSTNGSLTKLSELIVSSYKSPNAFAVNNRSNWGNPYARNYQPNPYNPFEQSVSEDGSSDESNDGDNRFERNVSWEEVRNSFGNNYQSNPYNSYGNNYQPNQFERNVSWEEVRNSFGNNYQPNPLYNPFNPFNSTNGRWGPDPVKVTDTSVIVDDANAFGYLYDNISNIVSEDDDITIFIALAMVSIKIDDRYKVDTISFYNIGGIGEVRFRNIPENKMLELLK